MDRFESDTNLQILECKTIKSYKPILILGFDPLAVAPVNQMVNHGGSVTINCTYPIAEERIIIRSFCREDENFNCINLISAYNANHTKRDRLSLIDDKQQQGVYTVTISTVTQDDAGRYQCAMEEVNNRSTACLTEINLLVLSEY